MNVDLTIEYLQTKQRLSALSDWRRIEQIRLEKYYQKTKDVALLAQIAAIEEERRERIERVSKDLDKVIDRLTDPKNMKQLNTPLKRAMFAHDLK